MLLNPNGAQTDQITWPLQHFTDQITWPLQHDTLQDHPFVSWSMLLLFGDRWCSCLNLSAAK
jgi:hypothetical protein